MKLFYLDDIHDNLAEIYSLSTRPRLGMIGAWQGLFVSVQLTIAGAYLFSSLFTTSIVTDAAKGANMRSQNGQETKYPNFQKVAIQTGNEDIRWITNFPIQSKGKRRDDLISFGSSLSSSVILSENPLNKYPNKM